MDEFLGNLILNIRISYSKAQRVCRNAFLETESFSSDPISAVCLEQRIMLSASPIANLANAELNPDAPVEAEATGATSVDSESGRNNVDTTLVFVDESVPDYEALLADIDSDTMQVIVLSSREDGIDQISRALALNQNVSSIHILSHGTGDELKLGNTILNRDSLSNYSQNILGWRDSLTSDADILFYGCNVAATENGRELVESIAALSGADVTASDDLTGHQSFGGDWELEYATGDIETDVIFSQASQSRWLNVLAITVDSTSLDTTPSNATSDIVSHTTSGTDRLLLVGISFGESKRKNVDFITYNGESLFLVGSQDNDDDRKSRVEIWAMVAPDVGTHDLVINYSGGAHEGATIGVMTFNGVDQSSPLGAFAGNQGDSSNLSVDVISDVGEFVFGVAAFNDNDDVVLGAGPGQTESWELFQDRANGAGSLENGAAMVNTTWTASVSDEWAAAGVSIKAANVVDIESDLRLHLEFEDSIGSVATDSSVNGNDATLAPGAQQDWTGGAVGSGGFQFDYSDGNEDYFEVANSPSLENVQESNSFTLAAWYNPGEVPPDSWPFQDNYAHGILIKEGKHTGLWYDKDQKFTFEHVMFNGSFNEYFILQSINSYSPGQFYHVAATFDRVAGEASLYINGELESTSNFSAGTPSFEYNQETWKIGTAKDTFSGNAFAFPAKGAIDDVRIYERELSDNDIDALYALAGSSNPPAVTPGQTFSVSEASPNGTSVGNVAATDPDGTTSFSNWTIVGGNSAGIFSIDSATGELTVTDNRFLDFETTTSYILSVNVSDGSHTSVAKNVVVNVANANDNAPVIAPGQSFNVNETAANGAAVGTVLATDEDGSTTFSSWTITSGNSVGIFEIDPNTGEITIADNANLDFEVTTSYSLAIRVSDGVNISATETVTVNVVDFNDTSPVIFSGQSFSVSEVAGNGTAVGTVVGDDADAGSTIGTWTITGGNTGSVFAIDPTTGELTIADDTNLDFATTPTFTLGLTVSDGLNTSAVETVVINVIQASTPVVNNDSYVVSEGGTLTENVVAGWHNPSWKSRQKITFDNSGQATNLLNHAVLIRLHASAADAVNVEYSKTQNNGEDLRLFDGDGALLNHQIESWNETGYSFVWVEVPQIDAGSTTDFVWMYYDHPSAMDGQNTAATWNSDYPAVLHLNTNGTDSSANANDGTGSNVSSTGGIIGDAGLFNGTNSFYRVDAAPSIENIFDGGGTISAWINPSSWGENGYGRIADKAQTTFGAAGNGDGWALQVAGSGGAGQLRFEQGFSGSSGAWTTNLGSLSLNTWQHVVLIYDSSGSGNDPQFYINGVQQTTNQTNTPIGTYRSDASQDLYIGNHSGGSRTFDGTIDEFRVSDSVISDDEISAHYQAVAGNFVTGGAIESGPGGLLNNDSDSDGDLLTISLVSGPSNAASFTLNTDGSFSYAHDGSETTSDSFVYQVSDGMFTQNGTVSLNVSPVNDNLPNIVTGQTYSIGETAGPGSLVGTATATDGDPGTVFSSWTITGGNTAGIFAIDPNTGEITIANNTNLDYETTTSHTLSLTVSDGTNTSITETVLINVIDENDAPIADAGSSYNIFEGGTLTLNGTLSSDDSGVTSYRWDLDNDGLFGETGEPAGATPIASWSTIQGFGISTPGNYTIGLQVVDADGLSSSTTATITVVASVPVFTSPSTTLIDENQSSVLFVAATAPTGVLNYQISGGSDAAKFVVDVLTGELSFVVPPDFEAPSDQDLNNQYQVEITAENGFNSTTQSVTVAVQPINESPTVQLLNPIGSITENTGTSIALRVADIVITDDGEGTNVIQLSGTDSTYFEIVGSELRLRAGTTLDFESKPYFDVVVEVVDGSLPSRDSQALRLNVDDINEASSVANDVTVAPQPAPIENANPSSENKSKNELDPAVTIDALKLGTLPPDNASPESFSAQNSTTSNSNANLNSQGETVEVDDAILKPVIEAADSRSQFELSIRDTNNSRLGNSSIQASTFTVFVSPLTALSQPGLLWKELDAFRESAPVGLSFDSIAVGTVGTATSGMIVGYVVWALRSGLLLSSLMASMPAWNLLDPLAIVVSSTSDGEQDDESLAEIVETQKKKIEQG